MNLDEVYVRAVVRSEEPIYRRLMASHHYLGDLPKIGHTLWYVATYDEQWVGLLSFSAAAWKCAVRDRWIGWDFHRQYDYHRLKLIANNSRFLILPHWHIPNLGSKILSLCQNRLSNDWQQRFGHRLLLLETFVDPQRFLGTVYRAANWTELGLTRGYRRTPQGYSATPYAPKKVFVKPLQPNARTLLSQSVLPIPYRQGVPKMRLSAQQMQSLPDFFIDIPDPRRRQGRRHPLCVVLAIVGGATLCGMRGFKAIADYLVTKRQAHYHFTVKANQSTLLADIALMFEERKQPDFVTHDPPDHGRIETRSIWTTTDLNGYLNFPHVGQAFAIERLSMDKKTGKSSREMAYGITSRSAQQANAKRLLEINRGHWTIENSCHYILDWNYDEDRIRSGYGPENMTRLRRFAVGVIKSKGVKTSLRKCPNST